MLTDHEILLLASLLLCLFFLHRIQQIRKVWQAFGNLPAYPLLVAPTATLDRVLPRIPWISGGGGFGWRIGYEGQALSEYIFPYAAHGLCIGIFATSKSDIVQLRSLIPYGVPHLLLADATAAKVGPMPLDVIVIAPILFI